jgi:hypothetical protein
MVTQVHRGITARDWHGARSRLFRRILEAALAGDTPLTLADLAKSASTTIPALVRALSKPDNAAQLEKDAHAILRFLGILLAVRLLRGANEKDDLALAKLALTVVPPPADDAAQAPAPPVAWSDLLAAASSTGAPDGVTPR